MLPNRFSIYLHDTPAIHLFDKPVRTFSAGCVRVENRWRWRSMCLAAKTSLPPC